jgi:hypothetical protein
MERFVLVDKVGTFVTEVTQRLPPVSQRLEHGAIGIARTRQIDRQLF